MHAPHLLDHDRDPRHVRHMGCAQRVLELHTRSSFLGPNNPGIMSQLEGSVVLQCFNAYCDGPCYPSYPYTCLV